MLPAPALLRVRLRAVVADKARQGHVVDGLAAELDALPPSLDELAAFAGRLAALPLRDGWPYQEPDGLDEILAAADPDRTRGAVAVADAAARAEAAFLGSVCGCILGKPLEIDLTLDEMRAYLEPVGEWPVVDYLTERAVLALPRHQPQWPELVREHIRHVAPDDDINYTVLGMLALEAHGTGFTHDDLLRLWVLNLPLVATFGPERNVLVAAGLASLGSDSPFVPADQAWAAMLNPGEELCGALIRADAYGYACLGHPALAAQLAWRDATLTHRRTGVYGAMFVAAAIAAAPLSADPVALFDTALGFVPRRSRFAEAVEHALTEVAAARDWLDGYRRIHDRYGEFGHCRVLQEVGTLVNTLRFAESVGHGIGLQVSQGNDTDSFGASAGSLLGAYFGPGHLEDRWIEPFQDDIHLALATCYERSLSRLAARMGALPGLLAPGDPH